LYKCSAAEMRDRLGTIHVPKIGNCAPLGGGSWVHGDPAPLERYSNHPLPLFGICLLWPKTRLDSGWIKMPLDIDYGGRPRPSPHCVRWGPSFPSERGTAALPLLFGPCLLWPHGRPS